MKDRILIVEDDDAIARGLIHNLTYEGYEVRLASHGNAVIPIANEFKPDLIILDVMLPGRNGFDIMKEIRASGDDVYIIILSARTMERDKVEGLNSGADDYVSKPFGLMEFLARIASAMRRIRHAKRTSDEGITSGDLHILPGSMTVTRNGVPLRLTPKAIELMIFFARNAGRTFSRKSLINNIWGDDYEGTERTIDNFVLQIRGQIEDNPAKPRRLETVHGIGYRFIG